MGDHEVVSTEASTGSVPQKRQERLPLCRVGIMEEGGFP